jgi:hypothetical protein
VADQKRENITLKIAGVDTVFNLVTEGNFSLLALNLFEGRPVPPANPGPLNLRFIQLVLPKFEEKYGLRVRSWQTGYSVGELQILINHEPKEKAEATPEKQKEREEPLASLFSTGPDLDPLS